MALHIPNPKKSPAWARKAREGVSAAPRHARVQKAEGEGTQEGAPRRQEPKQRAAPPRPGSLVWAIATGWQLATNYETGAPLVYAWKPSGEHTGYFPAGLIATEATWYGPALKKAVEMSKDDL